MTETKEITLGGKAFKITVPFTLGQIEDLRVAVVLPTGTDPQDEMRRDSKRSRDIILAAIQPDHPDLTDAELRTMRISVKELAVACGVILTESGLVKSEEPASGEAPAEAAAA